MNCCILVALLCLKGWFFFHNVAIFYRMIHSVIPGRMLENVRVILPGWVKTVRNHVDFVLISLHLQVKYSMSANVVKSKKIFNLIYYFPMIKMIGYHWEDWIFMEAHRLLHFSIDKDTCNESDLRSPSTITKFTIYHQYPRKTCHCDSLPDPPWVRLAVILLQLYCHFSVSTYKQVTDNIKIYPPLWITSPG